MVLLGLMDVDLFQFDQMSESSGLFLLLQSYDNRLDSGSSYL